MIFVGSLWQAWGHLLMHISRVVLFSSSPPLTMRCPNARKTFTVITTTTALPRGKSVFKCDLPILRGAFIGNARHKDLYSTTNLSLPASASDFAACSATRPRLACSRGCPRPAPSPGQPRETSCPRGRRCCRTRSCGGVERTTRGGDGTKAEGRSKEHQALCVRRMAGIRERESRRLSPVPAT